MLDYSSIIFRSFRTEGNDRVDLRGTACGEPAGESSHDEEHDSDDEIDRRSHGARFKEHAFEQACECPCAKRSEGDACSGKDQTSLHDQSHHFATGGPEGHPKTKLPTLLGHRVGHDGKQTQRGEREGQR